MVDSIDRTLQSRLEQMRRLVADKHREFEIVTNELIRLQAHVSALEKAYEVERQYAQDQGSLPPLPEERSLSREALSVLEDGVPRTLKQLVSALSARGWRFAESTSPGRAVHMALSGEARRGTVVKEGGHWRKA